MRVIVVDDDAIVAMSLQTILQTGEDVEVAALGYDGAEAVSLYRTYKPDVLLMDIQMKNMTGLAAAAEILREFPEARIIFLTTFRDDGYIKEALEVGAKGYILKQDYQGVLPAVKAVYSGQNVYGNSVMEMLPKVMEHRKDSMDVYKEHDISTKEYAIIECVADGLSNKEIAEKLCLSEGTVRNYLSVVLEKLGLRDRTQLAVFYYKNRI